MGIFKFNDKEIYIEKAVADILKKKMRNVKLNNDFVGLYTAGEGYGKSWLACQHGAYLSKLMGTKFSIDNIHFTTDDLMNKAEKSPPYTVHILDEARANLYRGSSNSKKNLKFTHWISEARDKQQIILICLPSIHDMDKYISMWRLHFWVLVTKKLNQKTGIEERGFYNVMGIKKRKQYLKYLDTKYISPPGTLKLIKGKFNGVYPLDEEEYKNKKAKHRQDKFLGIENKTLTPEDAENIFIYKIKNGAGISWDKLAEILNIPSTTLRRRAVKGERLLPASHLE